MTIGKFLSGLIISQILFVIVKVIFIHYLNIDSYFFIALMWIVLSVVAIAIVRRMGVLNYFEAFFIAAVWTIASLIVDFIITTSVIGRDVYSTSYFWLTYLLIIVVVIMFHKANHVEIRKALRRQMKK